MTSNIIEPPLRPATQSPSGSFVRSGLHCHINDLTPDVREHHSETITRFVWSFRPKIKHSMITGPYDLDTVEEAFDVALKLDLTFKIPVSYTHLTLPTKRIV